jgi:hypothetical protein
MRMDGYQIYGFGLPDPVQFYCPQNTFSSVSERFAKQLKALGAQKNMTGKKENSSQPEYEMFCLQSDGPLQKANMSDHSKNKL